MLGPDGAQAIAEHVREECGALIDIIMRGDVLSGASRLQTNANLALCGVGVQGDAIVDAIEEANRCFKNIRREILKNGKSPKEAGNLAMAATNDFQALRTAIVLFTPTVSQIQQTA